MSERLVIVDYKSGNLPSAEKAVRRAAVEADLSVEIAVSGDADAVRAADRVILPGVGAFASCRAGLDAAPGLTDAVREAAATKPFLGVCVGMQLLSTVGLEHGETQGLDIVPGTVDLLKPRDAALKLPHMGWNEVAIESDHPALRSAAAFADPHAYFVHSYHLAPDAASDVLATADYGGPFAAIVGRGPALGTQFHPEKSQGFGLKILEGFLKWRP
ncbi:MAG: imidazole glycerol phosphate synthase subunit HisH [Pseudomonadota bacterium]